MEENIFLQHWREETKEWWKTWIWNILQQLQLKQQENERLKEALILSQTSNATNINISVGDHSWGSGFFDDSDEENSDY